MLVGMSDVTRILSQIELISHSSLGKTEQCRAEETAATHKSLKNRAWPPYWTIRCESAILRVIFPRKDRLCGREGARRLWNWRSSRNRLKSAHVATPRLPTPRARPANR